MINVSLGYIRENKDGGLDSMVMTMSLSFRMMNLKSLKSASINLMKMDPDLLALMKLKHHLLDWGLLRIERR